MAEKRIWAGAFLFCLAISSLSQARSFKTVYTFYDGTDGCAPGFGALVQGLNGTLYGTAETCGVDYGTVFGFESSGMLTALYPFPAEQGAIPTGGLVQDLQGNFFGTTSQGGTTSRPGGQGVVFRITPEGMLGYAYGFCAQTNCTDGSTPMAGLFEATDGNLYGTTYYGGTSSNCDRMCGGGTVFKITHDGELSTLYNFCSQANCADGQNPAAPLIQATDGNFYGVTPAGGENGDGTVFKITSAGVLTTLHSFQGSDGQAPIGGLVQATDGNLYGTTESGGANNAGTVYVISPGGALTTLHSFDGTDGQSPQAGLVQSTNGNLYGTTELGGELSICNGLGCGTIFEMTPEGTLATLHRFIESDGSSPLAPMLQNTNGTFYGTTFVGGTNSVGTIFNLNVGLDPFVKTLPTSGLVGNAVDILSQGLTGTTAVSFNGTAANFTVVSDTYLTATVPSGATTGFIAVTTPTAILKSNQKFRVTP